MVSFQLKVKIFLIEMKIAVSVLGARDYVNQSKEVLSYGADWIHIDVMDGKFVENKKFINDEIENLRHNIPDAFLDCHMMVENPFLWINKMAQSNVNMFTFHYESTANHDELIDKIHAKGMKAGMAINASTDVSLIYRFCNKLDMVLILTVDKTGIGGLTFNKSLLEKVKMLKKYHQNLMVEVDGGVNMANYRFIHDSGADIMVGGLVILDSSDIKKTIEDMKSI